MKIAVRMDDITPDMDWEKFEAFKTILDKYNIKPLLGIVPDCRDAHLHKTEDVPDFFDRMKKLKEEGCVLAMHGYRHLYGTKRGGLFPLNHFSEFAGFSYEKQKNMIALGKQILNENGIETDIFMAPAHSYDGKTLKALKENGFTKITDGFGKSPYLWRGMTFYPISFLMQKSLEPSEGTTTMVVHINETSDEEMKHYEELFEEHKEQLLSYEEFMKETPVKRNVFGHIKEYAMASFKHYAVKMKS